MKNLFLVPTPDETRVAIKSDGFLFLTNHPYPNSPKFANHHIYITSDVEIKEGDWCISLCDDESYEEIYQCKDIGLVDEEDKKIILTTDLVLISNSVQAIPDKFLEWFINNPSYEEVEVIYTNCANCVKIQGQELSPDCCHNYQYKIIIPKEETKQECFITKLMQVDAEIAYKSLPRQETLEEAAKRLYPIILEDDGWDKNKQYRDEWIEGAKWQQQNRYSEEEVKEIIKLSCEEGMLIQRTINDKVKIPYMRIKDFTIRMFEQFKKK